MELCAGILSLLRDRPWVAALGLLMALSGCQYDPDDRCDPGQQVEGDFCVCRDGYVPAEVGCVACDEHASVQGSECVCDAGYMAGSEPGTCVAAETGLGDACDPAGNSDDCLDSAPFCQLALGGDEGYCTQTDCTTDSECPGSYVCDTRTSPSYCERPVPGLAKDCASSADCDGAADYCVLVGPGGCAISGCSLPDEGCPVGFECCDLSSFGLPLLCTPEGQCPG